MTDLPGRVPPPTPDKAPTFRERIENLRHLGRLVAQIWRTSRPLTFASCTVSSERNASSSRKLSRRDISGFRLDVFCQGVHA